MDRMSQNNKLHDIWSNSMLTGVNAIYLEQMYENYLQDPSSVDNTWRTYFDVLRGSANEAVHSEIQAAFKEQALHGKKVSLSDVAQVAVAHTGKNEALGRLIDVYRSMGHRLADIDPLSPRCVPDLPELDYKHYGFSEHDLEDMFPMNSFGLSRQATLRELLGFLKSTYCGHVAAEFMHIPDMTERNWIQHRLESSHGLPEYSDEVKRRLLDRISVAEGLERYLHTKYVGQKRFSLEGAESLIPVLDEIIQRSSSHGGKEVVIGMAHRGRLNVLINVMGKMPADLFQEFEGTRSANGNGTGDVKYHMGFSSNIKTATGCMHVVLAFNPSHLEIVNPVVEGSTRARQDRRKDKKGSVVVPVLIHGDAAFAGQGVVMETLNMSQSRGFSTKGSVHIVVNNQIGFTTSSLKDARSTLYCTDVAKMVNAPIFHVNGDDPEAVLFVTQMALDYRMTFNKDVVIDLVCYRRHGHSEADEPSVTQPLMYRKIKAKPTTRSLYAEKLVKNKIVSERDIQSLLADYRDKLDAEVCVVPEVVDDEKAGYEYEVDWRPFMKVDSIVDAKTTVTQAKIKMLSKKIDKLPESFVLHPKVDKIYDNRRKMAAGAMAVDWGFAETLAYATLVDEGYNVRLSGQDAGRGTFFHRHAVLHNQQDETTFVPLRNVGDENSQFLVINSLLSEEAVLAFEYGYSNTDPNTLVIWEAQFGDFANNAQVVIDQFISAGEQKWARLSGLVMLLPHGFEGQGPEHSSARLERYLQLCAQHNMQVCVPTTPAQIFHLLRHQMHMKCRKPLIVMSPKSLLRNRLAVSSLDELVTGKFFPVIPEIDAIDDSDVKRIILCSGKVYYDLLEKRRNEARGDVVIIRLERLYPFPEDILREEFARYASANELVWCQEEPMNQGAWFSIQHHIRHILGAKFELEYAGRPFSAAPAVGYPSLHIKHLKELLEKALG